MTEKCNNQLQSSSFSQSYGNTANLALHNSLSSALFAVMQDSLWFFFTNHSRNLADSFKSLQSNAQVT